MFDRNKTELTQNITRTAALWLDGHGFKPVETEVGVAPGWVADVAGVCSPTQTEYIGLKLIRNPPRSRSYRQPAESDNGAFAAAYDAWRAEYQKLPAILTAVIEVKTSVGDFRGDRKWTATDWPASLCYVAMPIGLIPQEQWPAGWGVLLFSADGGRVCRVYPPVVRTISPEQHLNVVLSLAIRRDHATRYARTREFQKEVRIREGERKTVNRVSEVIGAVCDIAKGRPVDGALRYHRIKAKLPDHLRQRLESLRPTDGSAATDDAAWVVAEWENERVALKPKLQALLHPDRG